MQMDYDRIRILKNPNSFLGSKIMCNLNFLASNHNLCCLKYMK